MLVIPGIDWEFKKTKEARNFSKQELKVLVLGNSTAMDGINTEMISQRFGKAYNFSVGGASLETNYIQLEKYLEENAKPSNVLLFLSSTHVRYTGENEVHPVIQYYYNTSGNASATIEQLPLFKFRWLFVENLKKVLSSTHRSAAIVNGQLQIKRVMKDNSRQKTSDDSCFTPATYLKPGYGYMWKIIELCHKQGISCTVFEMPCWKNMQNNCSDITIGNGNLPGVELTVHNLNNRVICDTMLNASTDWLSKNHLNYHGSVKVTNRIIQILSQQGSNAPHH